MEHIPRFLEDPGQSCFLLGPRGTGKSWWIRRRYPDALIIDLLQPDRFRSFTARPERLREVIDAHPNTNRVVVDEIQKIPALLDVVHALIEERKELTFVLTGSSARKIRRGGVNLLGGRALHRTLHPFMAAELGDRFRLDEALRIGLVPLVVAAEDPGEVLRGYATLYLEEEVRAEGLVRNLGAFSRFLEAITLSHASLLNIAAVARECQVERKTVEGFVSILEDLLLAVRVPVFTKRAKRQTTAHPKLFLFDAGIFRSLRPSGPLDTDNEAEGSALEGLVFQHLRAWNAYRGERNTISYWRTRAGSEVDFIIYGEDGLHALEVKNARTIHPADLRSLKSFRGEYPESRTLFLYRGAERLLRDGILCLPCEGFLRELRPERSLDDAIG